MYTDLTLSNQNTNSSLQNSNMQPHNQSTVILQQFGMVKQQMRNFMDKVSDDTNKITHAFTTAQENTGKLIENAIL